MKEFQAALGITWRAPAEAMVPLRGPDGVIESKVHSVYSEGGPPAIELIQSVPNTPLAANGVSFHHLGFWTDRLARSSRDLDAHGWPCAATVASIDTDPRRFTLHESPYSFYVELFDTATPRHADTAGRYALIDMHVPPDGGPPPHRHDFEEMFTILDGEIELTFRGVSAVAKGGETINVPANAAHVFRNVSDRPARVLCLCSPAGQEEFLKEVGVRVAHRTEAPPALDDPAAGAFIAEAIALAPKYRTELLLGDPKP